MLKKIAQNIQLNKNVLEKKEINPIVQFINKNSFKSPNIFSDIGEDSATIKNDDKYILLTTDRIKTDFVENFPFGAGFSSILVGVDDIYCCGGRPLGASIILSYPDKTKGQQIIEGICEGSKRFRVPIIRGHTNTKGKCYELSSTMVGEIKKKNYISAKNAQVNDKIIFIVDEDGRIGKANKLYWDTVTFKNSEEILNKREAMIEVAEKQLVNCSKDISNGGIFGTLYQMIRYSNVGADVNINKIEIPKKLSEINYTLDIFINMYLTTSFILSVPEKKCQQVIKIYENHGLKANVIGNIITEANLLRINNAKESIDVLNSQNSLKNTK
ncbi:MAG: AIR synthase related protein [Promethearchaeota archaeon]